MGYDAIEPVTASSHSYLLAPAPLPQQPAGWMPGFNVQVAQF
jgi:hypothetical protein